MEKNTRKIKKTISEEEIKKSLGLSIDSKFNSSESFQVYHHRGLRPSTLDFSFSETIDGIETEHEFELSIKEIQKLFGCEWIPYYADREVHTRIFSKDFNVFACNFMEKK